MNGLWYIDFHPSSTTLQLMLGANTETGLTKLSREIVGDISQIVLGTEHLG